MCNATQWQKINDAKVIFLLRLEIDAILSRNRLKFQSDSFLQIDSNGQKYLEQLNIWLMSTKIGKIEKQIEKFY